MAETRTIQETTIIDTDIHLTVPHTDLANYVDDEYIRDVVKLGRIFTNGSTWDSAMGGQNEYMERADGFTDAEAVSVYARKYHIDYPIVNVNHLLDMVSDRRLSNVLMRAYNDYLLDRVLDQTDEIYGLAALSFKDPEKTAEEIDRIADEDQIVGGYAAHPGIDPPPGDPHYDVIFRALEDHDLPAVFHANADASVYDFPKQNQGFQKYMEIHSVVHMWYQTMAITSLVTQGVPVKFSDIDFVFLESGVSWVPYVLFRLNREYRMRKREAPLLEQSPEEYIRDRCYFASQPLGEPNDPIQMDQIINMIGADSLLFASDYPHWDFDHPDGLTRHLKSKFSAEERAAVLHENARKVFNF